MTNNARSLDAVEIRNLFHYVNDIKRVLGEVYFALTPAKRACIGRKSEANFVQRLKNK
jgi:ubiquinone/menaquinone biosynthesis C-methylase UbiE